MENQFLLLACRRAACTDGVRDNPASLNGTALNSWINIMILYLLNFNKTLSI